MQTLVERFYNHVIPEPISGCWLWDGCPNQGYGQIEAQIDGSRKTLKAHRVSFEIYKGSIPDDLEIDHRCRVRSCVNPDHLRAVPHRVNVLENSEGLAAQNLRKVVCKRGHPLSFRPNGKRRCIVCEREPNRLYARAKFGWKTKRVLP